jgi:hypothetical protein
VIAQVLVLPKGLFRLGNPVGDSGASVQPNEWCNVPAGKTCVLDQQQCGSTLFSNREYNSRRSPSSRKMSFLAFPLTVT